MIYRYEVDPAPKAKVLGGNSALSLVINALDMGYLSLGPPRVWGCMVEIGVLPDNGGSN